MSGGSLGQGLSIAVGMALGLRQKQSKARVYNSMSDGELDEGVDTGGSDVGGSLWPEQPD